MNATSQVLHVSLQGRFFVVIRKTFKKTGLFFSRKVIYNAINLTLLI